LLAWTHRASTGSASHEREAPIRWTAGA